MSTKSKIRFQLHVLYHKSNQSSGYHINAVPQQMFFLFVFVIFLFQQQQQLVTTKTTAITTTAIVSNKQPPMYTHTHILRHTPASHNILE